MDLPSPKPFRRNLADLPWIPYRHERFGSEDKDLTDGTAARKLSAVLTRLAPGQTSSPYHFHRVGEELFIILEGTGLLRHGAETVRVGPQDVITCPPGPESAHQFINDGDGPLLYYAVSTTETTDMIEYPDSGKVMSWVRDGHQRQTYLFKRESGAVDYFEGEA
jgi:uncharacterized cupin superfamily protein